MKIFTNGERLAFLDAAVAFAPSRPATLGWDGYTLVVFSRAPADDAWSVECTERLHKSAGAADRATKAAHKLAKRLGIVVPRDWDSWAVNQSGNLEFRAAQAWVANAAGRSVVLATVFPDIVWGTCFPEILGPLVAVVHWPPGANNDRSLCLVRAVCLGADAWTFLAAAEGAFRARTRAHGAGELVTSFRPRSGVLRTPSECTVRSSVSGTALCEGGGMLHVEAFAPLRAEETWSAEIVASLAPDDPIRAAVFANK